MQMQVVGWLFASLSTYAAFRELKRDASLGAKDF
jgi:hypothetical protein